MAFQSGVQELLPLQFASGTIHFHVSSILRSTNIQLQALVQRVCKVLRTANLVRIPVAFLTFLKKVSERRARSVPVSKYFFRRGTFEGLRTELPSPCECVDFVKPTRSEWSSAFTGAGFVHPYVALLSRSAYARFLGSEHSPPNKKEWEQEKETKRGTCVSRRFHPAAPASSRGSEAHRVKRLRLRSRRAGP